MAERLHPKLLSWASELDDGTVRQAAKAARLPIVEGHIALMPDAHVGMGATVGSVIPTKNAIIPSAVGVDIGCGMIAVETDLAATDLPDSLDPLLSNIARAVPSGVGRGRKEPAERARTWMRKHAPATELGGKLGRRALEQLGSLGSGNHFLEVCLDERDQIWVVLHSGSRGVGNQLAQRHISRARKDLADALTSLEDPDLAWFVQGTPAFEVYVTDMLWAQDYALLNREIMMNRTLDQLFRFVGSGRELDRINCHHNFAQRERHRGEDVWVTRKGAIKADVGDRGVIPGSMGTRSYVVSGRGQRDSWNSCSHGAGRRLSRTAAKKRFSADDLSRAMEGKVWLADQADRLIDEIPAAYKDIDQVMADQADLVEVHHTLRQVLNYKGT